MDSTINIVFNGEAGAMEQSPTDNPTPKQKSPNEAHGGIKQLSALTNMKQIGKTVLNFGTTRVQMYTGSGHKQDQINGVMSVIGNASAIISNPIMGMAMTALSLSTKALDYSYKRNQEDLQLMQSTRRAGPSLNRSRNG